MITPVGADRPRRVNVRVISATNQNLAEGVRQHRFRRDLYYRLNVFSLRLPPLRDRPDDVIPLANHFLRQPGRPALVLSADARRALKAHRWEGNVRELRSVMERASLVCKGREVGVAELSLSRDVEEGGTPTTIADSFPSGATLRELERRILKTSCWRTATRARPPASSACTRARSASACAARASFPPVARPARNHLRAS